MEWLELPAFPDDPLHDYLITLDGIEYALRFDYHGRQDRWYVTISRDGVRLVAGAKITNGGNLAERCPSGQRPLGVLAWVDPRGIDQASPGFADLGRRVIGIYVTAS